MTKEKIIPILFIFVGGIIIVNAYTMKYFCPQNFPAFLTGSVIVTCLNYFLYKKLWDRQVVKKINMSQSFFVFGSLFLPLAAIFAGVFSEFLFFMRIIFFLAILANAYYFWFRWYAIEQLCMPINLRFF